MATIFSFYKERSRGRIPSKELREKTENSLKRNRSCKKHERSRQNCNDVVDNFVKNSSNFNEQHRVFVILAGEFEFISILVLNAVVPDSGRNSSGQEPRFAAAGQERLSQRLD